MLLVLGLTPLPRSLANVISFFLLTSGLNPTKLASLGKRLRLSKPEPPVTVVAVDVVVATTLPTKFLIASPDVFAP